MDLVLPLVDELTTLYQDNSKDTQKPEENILDENILIVGHLPFLAKVVGQLLTRDENNVVVAFVPGSIVCLERIEYRWVLNWMLRPNLL